jgi:hypothetical protein
VHPALVCPLPTAGWLEAQDHGSSEWASPHPGCVRLAVL